MSGLCDVKCTDGQRDKYPNDYTNSNSNCSLFIVVIGKNGWVLESSLGCVVSTSGLGQMKMSNLPPTKVSCMPRITALILKLDVSKLAFSFSLSTLLSVDSAVLFSFSAVVAMLAVCTLNGRYV